MMNYQTKPILVTALQWDGTAACLDRIGYLGLRTIPAAAAGLARMDARKRLLVFQDLHALGHVEKGDWLVRIFGEWQIHDDVEFHCAYEEAAVTEHAEPKEIGL